MTVVTRWKCSECDCINEKKPAFKWDANSPYRIHIDEKDRKWKLIDGKCSNKNCGHSSKSHRFTFDKPGQ